MLFNTVEFFLFFFVILLAFYFSPESWRRPLLLLSSYYFYMSWNPIFILLLLALTIIDFSAGILIETVRPSMRRLALIMSLAANLGFLGFFKYYNLLASTVALLMGKPANSFFLSIVLPVGISFHTFQSLSYVIDVYRREQKAVRSLLDYALFIAFWPQLVSGPIVRAREFFQDLLHWKPPLQEDVHQGALLVLIGLTKKMAFADQFAKVSDAYFSNVTAHPGMLPAWHGTIAFALQVFFDFSGYTDIAIGSARLLGFHFPINFARPYLASSVQDFWSRWHISLSRWLRDFLFLPTSYALSRRWTQSRWMGVPSELWIYGSATMVTMLLAGLWHGATWMFVVWGAYHGLGLTVHRAWVLATRRLKRAFRSHTWHLSSWALTQGFVCTGWVFFRAPSFQDSLFVIRQMFSQISGPWLFGRRHIWMIVIPLCIAILQEKWKAIDRLTAAPRWALLSAIVVMMLWLEVFSVTDEKIPFIYFQF